MHQAFFYGSPNFSKKARTFAKHFLVIKRLMMDTTNKSTRQDWIIFFISLAIMILFFMYADEWFWVALPFVMTFFVRAIRVI